MLHESIIRSQFGSAEDLASSHGGLEDWTLSDLIAHAERQSHQGQPGIAAALYKTWIARHPGHEWLHAAYFNYSVALAKAGDRLGAINATRECLRIRPDFQPPYINLGRLLEDEGRAGDAVMQWKALIDQLGGINGSALRNKLTALEQLARVLEAHFLDGPAEECLRLSLDISLAQPSVIQHYIALRQRQCKWPAADGWEGVKPEALMAGISPLSLANASDDPLFQLARAGSYYRELVGDVEPRPWPNARDNADGKLRIGYVSSDLREHAVGFAMTDVFELHDRSKVEVFAYYCGIDREDDIRGRIRASADHWIDINPLTDEQAAERIRADGIDILVDLNGYTKSARTRIFALRPAPIAVNWFGFPGSMGSPDHQFIVADAAVIPPSHERFYSERVVRLGCYQPNDRKRNVSNIPATRAAEGLPDSAFVFCCLNGAQKVTPSVFAAWMRILAETPNSVLWLLAAGDETDARLRGFAQQLGVDPARLIFAQKRANPEHLARYPLADLFLDTFPYGAHTTAADAMWMGVPVLTFPGRSFASRVCASLVNAAGLDELVCSGLDDYVALAIQLGRDPARIDALKRRLAENRMACRLFDTPKLVRELEDAYRLVWSELEQGRRPVPDLTNLGHYHEIALRAGDTRDGDYLPTYAEAMARRHLTSPLPADPRAWPGR